MDFTDYDMLDEFREFNPLEDAKMDFHIPTPEEELRSLLEDSRFDFDIDKTFDANYYYEAFPNFPLYMYPILQEVSTGIKPDRKQLRKIILKERKRAKRLKKQNAQISKALNECKQQSEADL